MELEKIRAYAELMQELNLSKLEIREGEQALCLERGGQAAAAAPLPAAVQAPSAVPTAPAASEDENTFTVTSPMVGVFFAAPEADGKPYVKVGDHVKKGQTVCLMEAMKMMNEVQAPCDCVIEEILQEDGALVSFGEPLLRYREG